MSVPPPGERPSLRDGRYVLLGPLGSGTQGTTWNAADRREGRAVAIKRFDVRGARSWKDVELAEREANVLAGLSHSMLPRYIEHFEEDGALYLVMEKIDGTPLSELRGRGAMSEDEVLRLLKDADKVLGYLHGRTPAVIHRDLKPANVIRRPDGSFAFVDFGAVRDRLRPEGGSTVVGTFGYMAPEQFQGRAGPGSDVYAIGATALAMLTGEEPERLPHRGLALDVDTALAGRASGRLREALRRMLEVDPDKRATRIGPLLDRTPYRAEARGGSVDAFARDYASRVTRRAERHARRAEQRARRWAEREAQRETWRGSRRRRGPPWFVWLFLLVGLLVAQLAVVLTLRVVVPVVLVVLSIFFGRALRNAARGVSRAGDRANDAMNRAIGNMSARPRAADDPRARVADTLDTPEERFRVAPSEEATHAGEPESDETQAEKEMKAGKG